MRRAFPKPYITQRQAMTQLVMLLAGATDERILALTINQVVASYRVDRREAEVKLLAAQDRVRRSRA